MRGLAPSQGGALLCNAGTAAGAPGPSVVALDAVVAKFAERGIEAHLVGLNPHAASLHRRTTGVGANH